MERFFQLISRPLSDLTVYLLLRHFRKRKAKGTEKSPAPGSPADKRMIKTGFIRRETAANTATKAESKKPQIREE
jgi:hypothetical protein